MHAVIRTADALCNNNGLNRFDQNVHSKLFGIEEPGTSTDFSQHQVNELLHEDTDLSRDIGVIYQKNNGFLKSPRFIEIAINTQADLKLWMEHITLHTANGGLTKPNGLPIISWQTLQNWLSAIYAGRI